MQTACMNKHVHIRDFDGKAHKRLVNKAEAAGLSLTQYLKNELAALANESAKTSVATAPKRNWQDAIAYAKSMPPVLLPKSPAEIIREVRDEL